MALEIERKFLVKGDFRKDVYNSSRITQGYICAASGRTVRVRIRDDKGYLTIKGPSGTDGLGRFEWEKEIPLDDARELMKLVESGFIDKTRHLIRNADGIHTWEVDEFHGDNKGLIVAEVELKTPEDSFAKPDWLGEEVTGDRRYYNSMLSLNPYRNWKP